MPRYTLKCQHGHEFTSWFQSSEAYAKLKASGLITCAICGSTSVEKAVMSPQLRLGRDEISAPSLAAQHSEGAAPRRVRAPGKSLRTAKPCGHLCSAPLAWRVSVDMLSLAHSR